MTLMNKVILALEQRYTGDFIWCVMEAFHRCTSTFEALKWCCEELRL